MRRSAAVAAAVLLGYGLLAAVVFRPSWEELAHTAPAFDGISNDAVLLMWATDHVSRALLTHPLSLFEAGIYHPARHALAYGDHMIGQALVGLPVWLASGNPLLEYNLLVLASYVLGAAAMFALAREIGCGPAGAGAAGLVFAFNPYRFHSPLWLQVLFTPFMPLALLAWLRFVREPTRRAWAAWVACWALHGLMGLYLALYFSITMGALIAWALAFGPRERRVRRGLVLAPVAVGIALAPTLWPYALLRATQGHARHFGLDTPLSFFLPGPGTLTGWLAGLDGPAQFGPGLTAWGLALLGLLLPGGGVDGPGGRPRWFVRGALLVGLGTTLLLVLTPIRVQLHLPGLDMIRATNRAFFVSQLFLAAFAGQAVTWLVRRARGPRAARLAAAVLLVLLVIDLGRPPGERKPLPVGADIPPAYGFLRALPDEAVVYERVLGPEPVAMAMYFQIFHRKRIPIGYGGFVNPASTYVTFRLFRFPRPESLRLLRILGVGHVLAHYQYPGVAAAVVSAAREAGVSLAARFGADLVFRVGPDPAPQAVLPHVAPIPRAGWRLSATHAKPSLRALLDGDARTGWAAEAADGAVPELTIDLGTARAAAGVRCVPLGADPDAPGIHLARVELSADGARWEPTEAAFEPDSLATLFTQPADVRFYEARFPARSVRFVRLVNPEIAFLRGRWEIAELDVLEEAQPPPPAPPP